MRRLMKPSMTRFPGKTICGAAAGVVAAVFICCGGAEARPLPAAVRLARKLEKRAVDLLIEAKEPGEDVAAKTRRALHVLTQARDVLIKKRKPRPAEYVEELEAVRALAYWISRKTPVADVGGLDELYLPTGPADEAAEELSRKAAECARRRPAAIKAGGWESFALAARFFEIVDRYPGTGAGRRARALYRNYRLPGEDAGAALPPGEDRPLFPGVKSRRERLVGEFAEMLSDADVSAEDKLGACDKFLRVSPGDPLVREVAVLMDIFAAATPTERATATGEYLDLFPDGRFAGCFPRARDEAEEGETFEALSFELRSDATPREKERACRGFLAAHAGGPHGEEVRALLKVYTAKTQDRRVVAWVAYRAAFPNGVLASQAEEKLRRLEPFLLVQIKQALAADDEDRAQSVGNVYLDLFPRGPAVREIRELFGVLQKPRGPARAWVAEKYIKKYRSGTFTPILRKVVGVWRRKSEKADYGRMREAFLAAGVSEPERVKAVDAFLRANPSGAHTAEVRALRAVFKLRGTKGRLNAARKLLEQHPKSGVAEAVRGIERDLAAKHEREFYEIAASSLRSPTKKLEARLAAATEYLAEYPQGAGAAEIRAAAQDIRARIAEEGKAFAALEKRLEALEDPAEGVRLCGEFRTRYPGGPHLGRVGERRRGFERRLLEREEVADYGTLTRELKDAKLSSIERADRCLAFVGKYPASGHRSAVRAAMAALAPHELPSHAGRVRAAAFTSDSRHLVTLDAHAGSADSGLWIWELPEGKPLARYAPRPGITVESAVFSPEGNELWICEASGGLVAWAIPGGEVVGAYRLGWGSLKALGVSGDREVVVSASYRDPKVRSWDAEDWTPEGQVYAIPGGASAVAVDERGDLVAAGGRGGAVAVYRVGDAGPIWVDDEVHAAEIDAVTFSPDGRRLVSVSAADGLVCMWEAGSGEELWRAEEESTDAAFVGSGLVITGPALHDAASGTVIADLGGAGAVAVSPDGRFAFTTGREEAEREPGSGILWYLPALVPSLAAGGR